MSHLSFNRDAFSFIPGRNQHEISPTRRPLNAPFSDMVDLSLFRRHPAPQQPPPRRNKAWETLKQIARSTPNMPTIQDLETGRGLKPRGFTLLPTREVSRAEFDSKSKGRDQARPLTLKSVKASDMETKKATKGKKGKKSKAVMKAKGGRKKKSKTAAKEAKKKQKNTKPQSKQDRPKMGKAEQRKQRKELEEKWKVAQTKIRKKIDKSDKINLDELKYVGGVDVRFSRDDRQKAVASISVCSYPELALLTSVEVPFEMSLPYIPGYLAFREIEGLNRCLALLKQNHADIVPQVLLVDGNGIFHFRGCGYASHFGVVGTIPTVGVGRKVPTFMPKADILEKFREECKEIGSFIPLMGVENKTEVLARALRTVEEPKANPVFLSVGHQVSLETATQLVLKTTKEHFRIPEPIRLATKSAKQRVQEVYHPDEPVVVDVKKKKKPAAKKNERKKPAPKKQDTKPQPKEEVKVKVEKKEETKEPPAQEKECKGVAEPPKGETATEEKAVEESAPVVVQDQETGL